MSNENEQDLFDQQPVQDSQAAPVAQHVSTPYVRQRAAHHSVGTIDDLAEDNQPLENMTHDSNFTTGGNVMSGRGYRRSRAEGEQLRRDLHYGQYLEIPKGRRDIFASRERKTRLKTFLALVVVLAVLAVAVYFCWQFMQTNWGSTY
jgi:hypothetical protein